MIANDAYLLLLRDLTSPNALETAPRHQGTLEIMGRISEVDMFSPIVTIKERELDYQFMAAEAHWILRGNRRLDHHPAINRNLNKYSDDGVTMRGAYGPPFLQQVEYVVETLTQDPMSRQAVMTL